MNRSIPTQSVASPDEHDAVSPFRRSRLAADEHDAVAAVHCLCHVASPCTRAWLCVCGSTHLRPCSYVRGRIFCSVAVRMCTRLRRDNMTCYVGGSTTTHVVPYSATVHLCRETDRPLCTYTFLDQTANGTYALTWWVPTVRGIRRHLLACEDITGRSQLSVGTCFRAAVDRVGPFCRSLHV